MIKKGPNTISLIESLQFCITRICEYFNNNWLKVVSNEGIEIGGNHQLSNGCQQQDFQRAIEPDVHTFTEICACISGSFALQINNGVIDMDEGDITVILPSTLHAELLKSNREYMAVWIAMVKDRIVIHLSAKDPDFVIIEGCSLMSDLPSLQLLITNVKDETDFKTCFYSDAGKAYILSLLIRLIRSIESKKNISQHNANWKESVTSEIMEYIQENYASHIRLSDLSQKMFISANYLNAIFKSEIGWAIIQYIENFRIEKAKVLLKTSNYSINDISKQLGYYDQFHFCKFFKKLPGCLPRVIKTLIADVLLLFTS